MNLLKLLNYNSLLGLGLTAIALYLLQHAGDISEANDIDKEKVQLYIVIGALVIFGFFALFRTVIGLLFKAASYLVIVVFIYKLTETIEEESIVVIIDICLVVFSLFALYAFVSTLYHEKG